MPRKAYRKELQMISDEKDAVVEVEKAIRIIVDGTPKVVPLDDLSPDNEISYEQVVRLSSKSIPSGPYIDVEVDYTNAAARPPDGSMTRGESVKIQDGTVFDVEVTDRS